MGHKAAVQSRNSSESSHCNSRIVVKERACLTPDVELGEADLPRTARSHRQLGPDFVPTRMETAMKLTKSRRLNERIFAFCSFSRSSSCASWRLFLSLGAPFRTITEQRITVEEPRTQEGLFGTRTCARPAARRQCQEWSAIILYRLQ